jgi:endonuclease/exonuclease/phosphatase family metal-dependent hydrolase
VAKGKKKPKKQKKIKRKLGCLFIILLLLVCGAAFLIYNNKEIGSYVEEKVPTVKTVIDISVPVAEDITEKSIPVIKEYAVKAGNIAYKIYEKLDDASKNSEDDAESIDSSNLDELIICSFNIRIFSDGSRDNDELKTIVQILKLYDLIAIQELRDKQILKRTVKALKNMGYKYDYEISGKVGRGVKERYAFLYRKDKVEVIESGRLYTENNDEFIREPYYATFKSGNFDFTLVTVHVLFGDSKKDRRPELLELANVFEYLQNKDDDEQDIILLGDFNMPPSDKGWDKLKQVSTMKHILKRPSKTTIQDSSLYDNFWFQKKYVKEYSSCGVYKFDEVLFDNDDKVASRTVSDHRPLWGKFVITKEDDD